jgi:hypothetical protein
VTSTRRQAARALARADAQMLLHGSHDELGHDVPESTILRQEFCDLRANDVRDADLKDSTGPR